MTDRQSTVLFLFALIILQEVGAYVREKSLRENISMLWTCLEVLANPKMGSRPNGPPVTKEHIAIAASSWAAEVGSPWTTFLINHAPIWLVRRLRVKS